jgi:integrase
VLQPIWAAKNSTARYVRSYIEAVFTLAEARGFIVGKNPAEWKGRLQVELSDRKKRLVNSHAAMPFSNVPTFMRALRERQAIAARALEFTVLCASRTSEVLGATWQEFDLDAAIWNIPDHRMKSGKSHRVPLTASALKILTAQQINRNHKDQGHYVFGETKPLSNMAMSMLLRRMHVCDVTVHGFRSSFRDFAGDQTEHARDIAEMCLSHQVSDAVEKAYRRSDALSRRRSLMEDWDAYLS